MLEKMCTTGFKLDKLTYTGKNKVSPINTFITVDKKVRIKTCYDSKMMSIRFDLAGYNHERTVLKELNLFTIPKVLFHGKCDTDSFKREAIINIEYMFFNIVSLVNNDERTVVKTKNLVVEPIPYNITYSMNQEKTLFGCENDKLIINAYETGNISMRTFLHYNNSTVRTHKFYKIVNPIILQCLYTILFLESKSINHNALTIDNITLKKLPNIEKISFNINNREFYVYSKYLVCIENWENCYHPKHHNYRLESIQSKKKGLVNDFIMFRDLNTFIRSLKQYKNVLCIRSFLPHSRFINFSYSQEYKNLLNYSKLKNSKILNLSRPEIYDVLSSKTVNNNNLISISFKFNKRGMRVLDCVQDLPKLNMKSAMLTVKYFNIFYDTYHEKLKGGDYISKSPFSHTLESIGSLEFDRIYNENDECELFNPAVIYSKKELIENIYNSYKEVNGEHDKDKILKLIENEIECRTNPDHVSINSKEFLTNLLYFVDKFISNK